MAKGNLKVATCQFAVSSNVRRNGRQIRRYMREAKGGGAEVVHFPESSISGYAGVDVGNFEHYDWGPLVEETEKVIEFAGELGIWVVVGSTHRLCDGHKPHNCLYLISPKGEIADRYDKRFCMKQELRRYTPGKRSVIFEINGVKCALLICFELRFAEIYRDLCRQRVKCVFQSFYNARQKGPSVHSDIMRQSMQCRAASNGFWVSMSNASGYYSPYGSCFIRPDGKIIGELVRNRAGMMINAVDLSEKFYDPMEGIREMAMEGRLDNGEEGFEDERSEDVKSL